MTAAIERVVCGLTLALAVSCAATPSSPAAPTQSTTLPADVVVRAALPLSLSFRGRSFPFAAPPAEVRAAHAICLGESHDNPHHHYAQWRLLEQLHEQRQGRPLALGFEMFPTVTQPALDAFATSGDLARLLAESRFRERWGDTLPFYEPLLTSGRAAGARLLGLNAERSLTRAVASGGLAALEPGLRASLPELVLDDAEHRATFEQAIQMKLPPEGEAAPATPAHGDPHGTMDLHALYAAQVVWDETMAETAATWLRGQPHGQILIIAGSVHCHPSAIPRRIARRGPWQTIAGRALLRSEFVSTVHQSASYELVVVLEDG